MLESKCFNAKNIYNHGNYLIRQEFIKSGKWLRYVDVEKQVKNDIEYPDYWEWNLANSGQQVLRQLDKNWKSFFKIIKDWKVNKEKYKGKPKLPKYLHKNGLLEFALTTNQVKLKEDDLMHFPKSMNGFIIKPYFINDKRFIKFNQCRIVPRNDKIIVELIYTISFNVEIKNNNKICSIDLGVDNFVALVNNIGNKPIIINGKGLKSCNQYYNKQISKLKSELDKNKNSIKCSHLMNSVTNKRNFKINRFMDEASNYVVNYCLSNDIATLIVGKNDEWKQNSNLGKVNNQNFVGIPFNLFIQKLDYKCRDVGIKFILIEEKYTSGTSFLDNELPIKENYNKSRRIKRGLFKTDTGKLINADVNGAYQIMKKVFCDVEIPADRGFVINPVRVNFKF